MKLKTILIAGVLPLALFAKDDDLAGKIVPRLIESRNTELNQNIDGLESLSYAPEAENPSVGKFVINESSFSQKKSKRKKTPKVSMPTKVEASESESCVPVSNQAKPRPNTCTFSSPSFRNSWFTVVISSSPRAEGLMVLATFTTLFG